MDTLLRPLRAPRTGVAVSTLVMAIATGAASPVAAQDALALHGVALRSSATAESHRDGYVSAHLDWTTTLGAWELSATGEGWLDTGRPRSSLFAPADFGLRRGWSAGEVRIGLGSPDWGLSRERSPASALAPEAVLWSSVSGPPLGGPSAGFTVLVAGGELEAVFLPLRRPLHVVPLARRTWDGRVVESEDRWQSGTDYGIRFWRSFASMDLAVWWMDGRDGRAWVEERGTDGTPRLHRPEARQVGWEAEIVAGDLVLRSEGGLARRGGDWQTRALLGFEWFATPYLTLLIEQGVATDAAEAESPLVDDALVSIELVAERLRLRAGMAADPRSRTLHSWLSARWTVGSRGAVEADWVHASGDPEDEPASALRQPRALRLGLVRYF